MGKNAVWIFFEIKVNGDNELELKHYAVSEYTRERRPTSVNVGRSVFEKLADSLAGALCGSPAILR